MEVIFYSSVLSNNRFILLVLTKNGLIRLKCNLKSCYSNRLVQSSLCHFIYKRKCICKLMLVLLKTCIDQKSQRLLNYAVSIIYSQSLNCLPSEGKTTSVYKVSFPFVLWMITLSRARRQGETCFNIPSSTPTPKFFSCQS